MLMMACSAPTPGGEETPGVATEELVWCPPYGNVGDSTVPFSSYIYAINPVAATPWKLEVREKNVSTHVVTTKYINFGGVDVINSQANISGPGWTSSGGSQIIELDNRVGSANSHALAAGCPNDSNYVCMFAYESSEPGSSSDIFLMLVWDARYSYPPQGPYTLGYLNAINGLADGSKKIAFTGDIGNIPYTSEAYTRKLTFAGPKLASCDYPG